MGHVNRLIVLVAVDIRLRSSVIQLLMFWPSLGLVFVFIAMLSLGVLL